VTVRWWHFANPQFVVALAATALGLSGCAGMQSALDPAGPQAARISHLWWVMLAVCAAVFVLVLGVLLYAVFHPRRNDREVAELDARRRMTMTVGGGGGCNRRHSIRLAHSQCLRRKRALIAFDCRGPDD
jgi:hypothetical protein